MTRPRITFLSHTGAPGGGELALRRYLRATSLDVELVTMEAGDVWDGLPCPVAVAPSVRQVRRALRSGSGPVVANSMRAAFYAALLSPRRRALAYWVRDGLTESAMSPVALALTRHITARRTSHYLANSVWTAQTVRTALGRAAEQIEVVPSPSGIGEVPGPPRRVPAAPLRLLYLGRIAAWKAPHVAVRAVDVLRERGISASLTVAGGSHFGEDHYAGELADLASSVAGVTMTGHVSDVEALLASHDLLVHCSTTPEPFGQVVVQGLAAGIPVLASAHGGPTEILEHAPVPLLYPPGSPDGLAGAIAKVLPRYQEVTAWGVRRAQDYTDRATIARLDAVLTSWFTEAGPRPRRELPPTSPR
ncbi:glycosyltransferase family 4 protein [Ornithinimicrobium humiphilum]|uniref:Glycosyl transferase family 1 n=1 Tax=Ornithinimicrobium humiphilum TaxID=125288 RepID=A0A543KJN3_9MICO|nr:glycosyltransferase family 4 protein [Ornithinimicrobium humiphilum]TQM95278.1 glycosyl transferase family 1 [Ornithinimicrobium humiphilum]